MLHTHKLKEQKFYGQRNWSESEKKNWFIIDICTHFCTCAFPFYTLRKSAAKIYLFCPIVSKWVGQFDQSGSVCVLQTTHKLLYSMN
jgi:hypothetical protein